VQPLAWPDVLAKLRDHQGAGHRVVTVSANPPSLLAEVGRQLGAEETVGSPLVVRTGRYTGVYELPGRQGASKVSRVVAYLEGSDSVAWVDSYA
jgi:phosphatidylglycerophosphatase C